MIRQISISSLLSLCLLVSLVACSEEESSTAEIDFEALSQRPMVDGFVLVFNEQCAVCHGEDTTSESAAADRSTIGCFGRTVCFS